MGIHMNPTIPILYSGCKHMIRFVISWNFTDTFWFHVLRCQLRQLVSTPVTSIWHHKMTFLRYHSSSSIDLSVEVYVIHYGIHLVCRVSEPHGKAHKTHGKVFTVCCTWRTSTTNSWRNHVWCVSFFCHTAKTLLCAPMAHGKKRSFRNGPSDGDGPFAAQQIKVIDG